MVGMGGQQGQPSAVPHRHEGSQGVRGPEPIRPIWGVTASSTWAPVLCGDHHTAPLAFREMADSAEKPGILTFIATSSPLGTWRAFMGDGR